MKNYIKLLILCFLLFNQSNLYGNDQNNVSDSIKAINLSNVGLDLLRDLKYAQALDSLLSSLEIMEKIYNLDDSKKFARIYYLIAVAYKGMNFYEQAIYYSQLAEENYIRILGINASVLGSIYNNLGNVYRKKLNYNEALKYFNQALTIYKNQAIVNKSRISGVYYSIAETYYKKKKYKDVIQISLQYLNNADDVDKIRYYDLLGATYQELEKNEKAIFYYQKAIDLSGKMYSEESLDVAFEYLKLASFLSSINETIDAEKAINMAKPIIFSNGNEKGYYVSLYYRTLGFLNENKHIETKDLDLFKAQNNIDLLKAIEAYKNALEALSFPSDISSLKSINSTNNISHRECIDLLQLIGNVYIKISNIYDGDNAEKYIDNINLALDYYKTASSFVQRLRKEISGDDNKILLASLQQSTFTDVVKIAYLAYKADNNFENLKLAFINAEKLKSGSIFDRLEETLAKNNSLIPDSLQKREDILNRSITSYNEKLFYELNKTKPDSLLIDSLNLVIFELNDKRLKLNNYLETHYNDYYDLKYSGSLYNIEDIQQKLKNNEVLIEYVLNEIDSIPELYSILISNRSAEFTKQYIDNQFIKDIESSYRFMSDPRYMFTRNEDSKNFCISSHNLYQKLIEPFKTDIQDKKIIIVPDGKLNYLAFDALIDEMPDTTVNIRFNELSYLIKKNCINYSYSANLLFKFSDLSKKANKGVLAFAPVYKNETINVNNQKLTLMPLPGVQEEVENISNEIKTKIFQGANATESNFLQNSEKWDILHLAMHAYINDSLPAFSSLVFTQDDNSQSDTYGRLSTADIYNLNLNARLTVLSACNTGSGNLQKGEGIMSLARGFLYAGCPSIVMTLWEAEDNSATKIMSSFYKFLKKGKSKDEALRMAKLEYLSKANPRLAHPHYWLEYVNIGDSSPLFRSYDFYFFSLLILAFIAITTEQILRIRKARNKRT